MNLQICAGGSAIRMLEATLHVCAAGLGPPELAVMVIDPDKANGNYGRVKNLLNSYIECQKAFGGKLGPGVNLFGTKLDLLDTPDGDQGLKVWTPVQPNDTLGKLLNYDNLSAGSRTNQDIAHLFFNNKEIGEELGQGFRGHPAIGAAALALLPNYAKKSPWAQVVSKLSTAVQSGDGGRVCITGSVFGGTGASSIHPVARFVRDIPKSAPERLKIGVVAMVPYFQFVPRDPAAAAAPGARLSARSEWFSLATRSAVEYYDHLRKNNDWPFDAVYWVGDSEGMKVEYSEGGSGQQNPAHFVDLLAAMAALEFSQLPADRLTKPLGCVCASPRQNEEPGLGNKNPLDWPDLPLMYFERAKVSNALLRFFLAGAVHLGFGAPLMAYKKGEVDRRRYCVPWYVRRFSGHSLRVAGDLDSLAKLERFFRLYHFPWWLQMLSPDDLNRVHLFNRGALKKTDAGTEVGLGYLADLLWRGQAGNPRADSMDRFFSAMCKVPDSRGGEEGAANYLSLLAHGASAYIRRDYADMTVSGV